MKYLTGIKSADGLPLFTRSSSTTKQLPVSLIDTLNGIFTYGDSYGVKLLSADTETFKIFWKMYQSNLTLILIENECGLNEKFYYDKLDLLFDAMILLHGLDDLVNIKNVDKLKREIRISFPLLDCILNGNKFELYGDITKCVDVLMTSDKNIFQNALDTTMPILNTHYSCLIANGKIICASKSWWDLKTTEIYLLSLLCMTSISATCRDIPVYLPNKNPNTPLRLLTYNLTSDDTVLCFICSQVPAIDAVEEDIIRIWHPIYKLLVNLKLQIPRGIPLTLNLDTNLLCFLLINRKRNYVISSLDQSHKTTFTKNEKNIDERFQMLKIFYQNVYLNFFEDEDVVNTHEVSTNRIDTENCAKESYLLLGNFKCYALNRHIYEFYAIFNENIPTYAIRGVTQECLSILLKDNSV